MDGSGGPLKTLIFENRNYKNVSKPAGPGKGNEKDSNNMPSGLELTKDIGLSFGKVSLHTGAFGVYNGLKAKAMFVL